jgi:hypothetical protein|tara:strand:+ start:98 stop:397 length:300 start_codon:yes stop_codon:yes gene_type:complete
MKHINRLKNKKGFQVGDILPMAITFVVIAVAISLGADVLDDIQGTQTGNATTGTVAYNTSGYGLDSMNTFAKWLPTIALVIIIAIIIGILIVYLANRFT